MSEVTRLLDAAQRGDRQATADLLPLVYDELRKLAAVRMASEAPGQTLSATALVHEAYLRLVGPVDDARWDGRGHFFAAAAEAMRRILVDNARRKLRVRHGGVLQRQSLDGDGLAAPQTPETLVALSDALDRLSAVNAQAAELVKLRFFAGLTNEQAAAAVGVSPRKANQIWSYARAWLLDSLDQR